MKFIIVILIVMFLISFASSITAEDIKNDWLKRGLTDSEAQEMSSSNPSEKTQAKALQIQENEKTNNQINESILERIEQEESKRKDVQGLFFISILGIMIFGFIAFVGFKFISWGGV